MTIDVAILTYRPGKEFPVLLRRLKAQTCRPHRLLVINTERRFWNRAWEKEFPGMELRHITKEEFDHGATRRLAAELLDGEVLVFMTMDAVPADRYLLENLVSPLLNNPMAGACYARQLPRKSCGYLEKCARAFNYPEQSHVRYLKDIDQYGIKTFFCSDVCAAYWRESYEYAGGFPARAIFNEDMVMASALLRQGYAVEYAADAKVIHSHNYSAVMQLRRNFDLGVSQADFPEVFASVPPSEGEGIRMVRQTIKRAVREGKTYLVPKFVFHSFMRYAGYLLGKHYENLPVFLILHLTNNRNYWKNVMLSNGNTFF